MPAFRTTRRVEFADTDMEGMVHFARFLVFMETAEHELLRAAGAEIDHDPDGERWHWPRVKVECEYLAPLHFGDAVEIEVQVAERGRTSLTYEHILRRDGEIIATGRIRAVCCRRGEDGRLHAIPIPGSFAVELNNLQG
jgi:YbgC/YbaW family acyl-CoA thioester hydrolase